MPETLPRRRRDYLGPVTNTDSWDSFRFRPGDVVLSTPPKCGTTWSQAILMMLLTGQADPDREIWNESRWLDCGFRDRVEMARILDAQSHPRCIKSHTPFDGISYAPEVHYIAVYRHPIDVHFSLEKHVANMKHDWLDFLFPPEPGAAFRRFVENPATDMGTDDLTLASICHHFRSFRDWAHLPNVHFFHYAEMRRDPLGQIARFARILGIDASAEFIAEVLRASDFRNMKAVTARRASLAKDGPFRNEAEFFHSATSNKWVGRLSDGELAAYRARLHTLLDEPDRAWLETGRGALT